ncbi:hypothetical protein [Caballeronia sp. 15711]|uniref:hypothetical protein n=1 Tax=Caballeronia sp. 15711 TaxID=3391029 RepID=UPI0039E5BF5B
MTVSFDKVVNVMHVRRNWLRALIRSIGDAVIATNTLRMVTFVNSGPIPPTGWTRGNAVGKLIHSVSCLVSEDAFNPSDFVTSRAVRKEAGAQTSPRALLTAKDHGVLPIEHTSNTLSRSFGMQKEKSLEPWRFSGTRLRARNRNPMKGTTCALKFSSHRFCAIV